MATIPTVTAINSQTESNQTWLNQGGIKAVVQNTDNPLYPRNIMLDANTVTVQRPGFIFGMTLDAIIAVAIQYVPQLSWPPVITVQPVSSILGTGNATSFNVTATSELSSVTYQWQLSTDSGDTWSNVSNTGVYSGATTATLSISNNAGLSGNQYRVNVTNGSGTTTSNVAALIIDPVITSNPSSVSVAAPAAASFTVVATGLGTLSYQWQQSTDGGATFSNLTNTGVFSNVTTATMNISNSTGLNARQYRCKVTDSVSGSPNTTSSAAILTVT